METNIQIREVQVSYQPFKTSLYQIHNADCDLQYLKEAYSKETIGLYEEFMALLLNRTSQVLGCLKLSKGGLTGTVVDLRILFCTALKAMSSSIVIAHNHPSNNPTTSKEDQELV